MYDPGIGRFFAVDPLAAEYPYNSTYAFSENRVIDGVELEGLEYRVYLYSQAQITKVKLAYAEGNMKEVRRIINYALSHPFVDGQGSPSHYAEKQFKKKHPNAKIYFPSNGLAAKARNESGALGIKDGYMNVQLLNYEDGNFDALGNVATTDTENRIIKEAKEAEEREKRLKQWHAENDWPIWMYDSYWEGSEGMSRGLILAGLGGLGIISGGILIEGAALAAAEWEAIIYLTSKVGIVKTTAFIKFGSDLISFFSEDGTPNWIDIPGETYKQIKEYIDSGQAAEDAKKLQEAIDSREK